MLPADALRVIVRTPDVRVRVIARMPAVIRAVHVIARMPTVIRAVRVITRIPAVIRAVHVIARMPTVIRAVHVIARMPTVIRAVHVIVRKQKRCCPLVLSEVSHEHSTTADSRSESGSASYITWSPHPITRGHRTMALHYHIALKKAPIC